MHLPPILLTLALTPAATMWAACSARVRVDRDATFQVTWTQARACRVARA